MQSSHSVKHWGGVLVGGASLGTVGVAVFLRFGTACLCFFVGMGVCCFSVVAVGTKAEAGVNGSGCGAVCGSTPWAIDNVALSLAFDVAGRGLQLGREWPSGGAGRGVGDQWRRRKRSRKWRRGNFPPAKPHER